MVTRIQQGSTFFPGAMTLGATRRVDYAYEVGLHMGEELKHLGINMNLAPSLDVNNNPYNPVIGVRSYSDDPDVVGAFGTAFIRGLQHHVIATAKHFPGHGDTNVDSHLDLPTIDIDEARFKSVELAPFVTAIDAGVQAIMSAHINFPLITEEGRPCTLSRQCLTGLLREELGFDGLIVTDCMQMKAIQHKYTTPVGAKMAVAAGADLICVSHSKDLQIAAYEAVLEAVRQGEIDRNLIAEHVERILAVKADLDPMAATFEAVQDRIVNDEHKAHALRVAKDAVTLIKGKEIDRDKRTLLLACSPLATTIADESHGGFDIIGAIRSARLPIDTKRVGIAITPEEEAEILAEAKGYDQIIYCSYNANIHPSQIALMDHLTTMQDNTHVYSMRNPYDTVFSQTIQHVMAFYEYTPNSVQALISYLKGDLVPTGRPPVRL
jgi:beta-N-acetylhexosaminidase